MLDEAHAGETSWMSWCRCAWCWVWRALRHGRNSEFDVGTLAVEVPLTGIRLAAFFSRFDFPQCLRDGCHSFGGTN
jgi:hypothetical protein